MATVGGGGRRGRRKVADVVVFVVLQTVEYVVVRERLLCLEREGRRGQ